MNILYVSVPLPGTSPEYYIALEVFKDIADNSHSSWEGHTYPPGGHSAPIKAEYNISPHIYNYIDIISHSTCKWTDAHVQPKPPRTNL